LSSFDQVPDQVSPGTPAAAEDYLGLGEAARLLGITPQTLRRWADRGQIASYTTPGGHRRFPRSALIALAPAGRPRRPTLALMGAPARITQAYRDQAPGVSRAGGWLAAMPPDQVELFRQRGRQMTETLLAHLDANGPVTALATLRDAAGYAAEHGAASARLGASLNQAAKAFLKFRAPFVDELAAVARRRGLDTREATTLLVDAEHAMDELLLAFIAGWQEAAP
jgi:excisionase family DNA binding protein